MRCLSIYAALSLALATPVIAQGKWIDLPSNQPGTISSDNSDTACLDSRARLRESTCATFEVDDDGRIFTGSGDSKRWLHVDHDTEALELVSGDAPVGHWKGIKTVSPATTGLLSVFDVKKTAPQAPNYGPNWDSNGRGGYIKLKEWDGGRGGHHKQLRFTVDE